VNFISSIGKASLLLKVAKNHLKTHYYSKLITDVKKLYPSITAKEQGI